MTSNSLNDMVVVYNAQGRLDGEMVKSFLESNDIRVVLTQQGAGLAYGLTIGELGLVEILVDPENVEKAKNLLLAMEDGDLENDDLMPEDSEE